MFKANGKRNIGYCDILQEDVAKKSIYISTSKRVRPRLSKAGPERPDLWFQSQLALTQLNYSLPPCQLQASYQVITSQPSACSVWQLFWKEMLEIFPTLQNFVQGIRNPVRDPQRGLGRGEKLGMKVQQSVKCENPSVFRSPPNDRRQLSTLTSSRNQWNFHSQRSFITFTFCRKVSRAFRHFELGGADKRFPSWNKKFIF